MEEFEQKPGYTFVIFDVISFILVFDFLQQVYRFVDNGNFGERTNHNTVCLFYYALAG